MTIFRGLWLSLTALFFIVHMVRAANDVPTQFSNQGGIVNTRHNMSQSTEQSNGGATMNSFRNRYGEVCVYCHTPHGANTSAAAPLWNRSLPSTTYTTYDKLNTTTLTQAVYQPGAASLPCLSCHDGQQAIDAIINMPGSGQYFPNPDPTRWVPSAALGQYKSVQHRTMVACMACHDDGTNGFGGVATDFSVFMIGTDLRNDHPVGVTYPTVNGASTDWNTPNGSIQKGTMVSTFFDESPRDGRMDKSEIRLYDSGHGPSVECASCHDPHGVPSAGGTMNPTFLRKLNAGSAVCLTCHSK